MKRKLLSALLIAVLFLMQLIPVSAVETPSYDTSAVSTAVAELQSMKNDHYSDLVAILSNIMVYIKNELTDGESLENKFPNFEDAVDSVYGFVRTKLNDSDSSRWGRLVDENTSISEPGKFESENIELLIAIAIIARGSFIDLYNTFEGSSFKGYIDDGLTRLIIITKLGLPTTATNAEIYMAMACKAGPIVTLSNGRFVRCEGDTASQVISNFGFGDIPGIDTTPLNARLDEFIASLNPDPEDPGAPASIISQQQIIDFLNIFGLYKAPTPPTTPPINPPVIIPPAATATSTPTPTATPTATPTPIASPVATVPPEAINLVNNILNETGDILNETDPNEAIKLATDIISGAADDITRLQNAGVSTQAVAEVLQQAADIALSKVNTETINSNVTNGVSTAVIDEAAAQQMLETLDKIKTTADQLNAALKNASAGTEIDSVLNIEAKLEDNNVTAAAVQLTASLLDAAKNKDIDKVSVNTGLATISIAPDAIPNKNGEPVRLSVEKLAASSLTAEQKQAAGSSQVYEFKAFVGSSSVSSFNDMIEVSIPYKLKAGESANTVTVFYIDSKGVMQNVAATYDPILQVAKFLTNHFSMYIVKNNAVRFVDLDAVSWAKSDIEFIAAKGITNGIGKNKFNPKGNLTKAEFVAMIVRAFNLLDKNAENIFTDVKSTDWYCSAVASAYKAGLISGSGNSRFEPKANITRQEMAAIIARTLVAVKGKKLVDNTNTYVNKFADKGEISNDAVRYVGTAVKYGIMNGIPGNKFAPKANTTRAEVAATIKRLIYTK